MTQAPRYLPSGSQLPECWNNEMDRQIAWSDSEGVNSLQSIIRDLKTRFSGELYALVIAPEIVQRRLDWLEYGDNDYFKEGTISACQKAAANGLVIKPFDPSTYPYLDDEQRAAIASLSDTASLQTSRGRTSKKGLRSVSNEHASPSRYQNSSEGAGNLVNSASFQSTVSSASSRHTLRTSSLPKRHASNDIKRTFPSTIYSDISALRDTSSSPTVSPSSTAQGSMSGTLTAASTPSAMSFSMPNTIGGPKKHRPAPLDLTESGAGHARKLSDITIEKKENRVGWLKRGVE